MHYSHFNYIQLQTTFVTSSIKCPQSRIDSVSRIIYVTQISDSTVISDAPRPHAGRLGLDGTDYKGRLLGDDAT